ncbi:hypothetical protein STTU_5102 [Streptomyces sp. Tu6071]|nr:hypothetical protein STTU_5102 [Streptomyces sp. Tu6071]
MRPKDTIAALEKHAAAHGFHTCGAWWDPSGLAPEDRAGLHTVYNLVREGRAHGLLTLNERDLSCEANDYWSVVEAATRRAWVVLHASPLRCPATVHTAS